MEKKRIHKQPLVSFLMLNWNGISFTRKCLRSLLKTDYPNYEIIVVDNGSVKDEAAALEREFKKSIRVIRNEVNVGYAAGMNIAIKNSHGVYLMILNNDMEFGKNWLNPLVDTLKNNKDVGACQPKIKDLKKKNYFEAGGAAGGFMDIHGYPFARGRIFSTVEKDYGQYDEIVRISWAGVMLIKKEVLNKIGTFNPIYFNYGEDMDICYRIYGGGYLIVNIPSSIVYHVGGAALKKNMSKKFFFHHRNNIIVILINEKISNALSILLPRFFLDFITIFYYGLTGFPNLSISVVKAYGSIFMMFKEIMNERKIVQGRINHKYLKLMPIYKGSIVFKYFISKKRTFQHVIEDKYFCNFPIK